MAAAHYYSRSMVVARTWARAASYFFVSAAATMVSSFYRNSTASAAWRASSMAIEGGVTVHREAARFTGDAVEGERATDP
jgi:hypothetical protein